MFTRISIGVFCSWLMVGVLWALSAYILLGFAVSTVKVISGRCDKELIIEEAIPGNWFCEKE